MVGEKEIKMKSRNNWIGTAGNQYKSEKMEERWIRRKKETRKPGR